MKFSPGVFLLWTTRGRRASWCDQAFNLAPRRGEHHGLEALGHVQVLRDQVNAIDQAASAKLRSFHR
jgi:hypothetical protein